MSFQTREQYWNIQDKFQQLFFQVFSATDDDDDNDSKSGKSDKIITEESLTNDDVRNREKNRKKLHY